MSDKLINEKLKAVEKQNDELNEKAAAVQEDIKKLQKQFQAIREEQVRLQGEYRALNGLVEPEKEEVSKETKAKK